MYTLPKIQAPGIIKNTGIVKTAFSEYLREGFNIGTPPTEATEIKKKTTETRIKQNPIEYKSSK